jgi:hypothetical protein
MLFLLKKLGLKLLNKRSLLLFLSIGTTSALFHFICPIL